jgi:hypothetical protein
VVKCFFGFRFCGIASFPKIKKHGKILYRSFSLFVEFNPVLVQLYIFQDLCGPNIVVPKTFAYRALFVFCNFISSVSDVKETSPGRKPDPS